MRQILASTVVMLLLVPSILLAQNRDGDVVSCVDL